MGRDHTQAGKSSKRFFQVYGCVVNSQDMVVHKDPSKSFDKIVALGAVSNAVVDFMAHKSVFMQYGGLKQLVQLSKSIEPAIRVNAVWALKNLAFLVNNRCKEEILLELSLSTLTSLVCDPEASVQEQALALVRNLVDGTPNSIDFVFGEDGHLLHAIGRQLRNNSKTEVLIQVKRRS